MCAPVHSPRHQSLSPKLDQKLDLIIRPHTVWKRAQEEQDNYGKLSRLNGQHFVIFLSFAQCWLNVCYKNVPPKAFTV